MATHLRVMTPSFFLLWLAVSLYAVCIRGGNVRDFVTEDFFNTILSGDVTLFGNVGDIASEEFFSAFFYSANDSCAGENFYKYNDFINATKAFPGFGTTGTSDDKKREIAAFFAHVAYETLNLCYIEEKEKKDYCDSSTSMQYPCADLKQYYGRGPLLLSWNYNYGAAGNYLGVDLLNNPDMVAQNDLIAWKTALWFWNVNTKCHSAVISGQGFGATIQEIQGLFCNSVISTVNTLVNFYKSYCGQFSVDPGSNIRC